LIGEEENRVFLGQKGIEYALRGKILTLFSLNFLKIQMIYGTCMDLIFQNLYDVGVYEYEMLGVLVEIGKE
jgi:hypothetical protein